MIRLTPYPSPQERGAIIRVCLLIFLFCNIFFCNGQTRFQNSAFETGVNSGMVVKNYPVFPDRERGVVFNASYYKKLTGKKSWHRNYFYPEVTLQGWYGDLGNKKVLGKLYGVSSGFRWSQSLSNRFTVSEQALFGAAYFTRPFNEKSNPENITIGSSLTPLASARLSLEYHINPFFSILANYGILHASNGHYQLPNLGVNLPVFGLSIKYKPVPAVLTQDVEESITTNKKIHFAARLSLGHNEQGSSTGPVNGPKYPIYLASFFLHKNYSHVARWHAGVEGYYNSGVYDFITSQDYYETRQREKSFAGLLILGNEFLFGHVSMVTQGGLYLYNPFYHDRYDDLYPEGDTKAWLKTRFTARLGFQYYLRDAVLHPRHNIFIGWYVKTNFGQADFMELSMGYLF